MLFDFKFIVEYPLLICVCLVIVLLVKPLITVFTVSCLGYSVKTALTVASGLAQVGEFSFILAQEAKRLNLAGDIVYNTIIVCSIISITLNPSLFKKVPAIEKFLHSRKKLWKILNFVVDRRRDKGSKIKEIAKNLLSIEEYPVQKTAIIVGYGPTGKKVVNALIEHNVKPIVVEINIDTVNSLSSQGQIVIYGDSTKKNILLAAGIRNADYLIITVPSLQVTLETASLASALNPEARILARARFLDSKETLKQTGISGMVFEEEEVSNALTSLLLDDLEKQSLLAAVSELAGQSVDKKQK
jgi:CPA2 family monovalent cation:H+ antiporter-2